MFRLYENPESSDLASKVKLHKASSVVIDRVERLDKTIDPAAYGCTYIFHAVLLAGATIFRLMRSPFGKHLEYETSRATLFSAINLLRKMSITNDDGPAKAAVIMSQLWNSDRVFRKRDGSISTELRVRSRLAVSGVYDCAWWWREEFQGKQSPYHLDGDSTTGKFKFRSQDPI